jgi:hypothetical protein
LLQAKTSLTNQLEAYKVNVLCLPSDTAVALDETFIKPFQFISPEVQSLQNDFGDFLAANSFGSEENLKETEDPRVDEATGDGVEELPAPAPRADEGGPADGNDAEGNKAGEVTADPATEAAEDAAARQVITASFEKLSGLRQRVESQAAAIDGAKTAG